MEKENKSKYAGITVLIIFYFAILGFMIGFNFQIDKTGGWYQQNMPDLGGRQISDITFTDSLTGYAVTPFVSGSDSTFILKTTNGGDNWFFALKQPGSAGGFRQIQFINQNTGYVCGNFFKKTTNAGINWNLVNTSGIFPENMFVISNDTIWLTDSEILTGGIFRTTNGGLNWQKLDNGIFGSSWPNKIYFINSRIGFASNSSLLFRTTNSGYNWSQVTNNNGFIDMVFADSLIGYKTFDSTRKTTDGGLTWIAQKRPKLNAWNDFFKFALINKDTIWGVGGSILTALGSRGVLYKTTNGGLNWGYQIPDTVNININNYYLIDFLNKNNGWAHHTNNKGVHTTVGGNDTTIYTSISNNITTLSKEFTLYQNYPNPFNPVSSIKYQVLRSADIKLIVYNISGKEITTLVNKKQNSGEYSVKFDGSNLSSGGYFYTLFVDGVRIDTKKMLKIK